MENETNLNTTPNVNSNPAPTPPPAPTPTPNSPKTEGEHSIGPAIGLVIILAIIILGGLYFWSQRAADEAIIEEAETQETVESINTQSQSDDTSSIEADLEATDVDNVDAELNAAS